MFLRFPRTSLNVALLLGFLLSLLPSAVPPPAAIAAPPPQTAPLTSAPAPTPAVAPASRSAQAPIAQTPADAGAGRLLWPTSGSSPGGVYVYSFASNSWELKNSGLPSGWIWRGIVASPTDPERWLLWGDTIGARAANGQIVAAGTTTSILWQTLDAGVTWSPISLLTPTLASPFTDQDVGVSGLSVEYLSDGVSIAVLGNVYGIGNFFGVPENGPIFWQGSGNSLQPAKMGDSSSRYLTIGNVSAGADNDGIVSAATDSAFGVAEPWQVRYFAGGSTSPSGPSLDYGQLLIHDTLPGTETGAVAFAQLNVWGGAGNGNLYLTPDYRATPFAQQPDLGAVGTPYASIGATQDAVYIGGRDDGLLRITSVLQSPSTELVAGTEGRVGFLRVDRATHTAAVARSRDTQALYVLEGAGAEWQTLKTLPPDPNLASRYEIIASTGILNLKAVRTGGESAPCACPSTEQPVNTRSGNFWTSETDLTLATSGATLTWTRTYAHQAVADTSGVIGYGWQTPYTARLILPGMPGGVSGRASIISGRGNQERFVRTHSGAYQAEPGSTSTLTQSGDVVVQTLTNQQQLSFSASDGRLLSIREPSGSEISLTYTGTPLRLTTIADARDASRALILSYVDGRIERVTDSAGRGVQYGYDTQGNLTRVSDLLGRVTTYRYEQPSSHLLTQIEQTRGGATVVRERMAYDTSVTPSRVADQWLEDGSHLHFTYHTDRTVITTTPSSGPPNVQTFFYTYSNALRGVATNGQAQAAVTFDSNFNPSQLSDGEGHTTQVTANAAGLPTSVVDALNQQTRARYNTRNQPLVITDTLGVATSYDYDARFNLTRLTTGITTTSPLRATTLYTYSYDLRYPGDQLLTAVQGPDGVVTRYVYPDTGSVAQRGQPSLVIVGDGTALAQQTKYEYDALGRVITTTLGYGTALARVDTTVYRADNTLERTVQNYRDGVFAAAYPDEDLITTYGYDDAGRQVWVRNPLGQYDATHYNERGQVDWTLRNVVPFALDAGGQVVFQAFRAAAPDQNVAQLFGYDGLGRTSLITDTGLLSGDFNPATRQWSGEATRVTRIEYDALSRPITTTLNYRPEVAVGALPDVNLQTLQYYDGAGNVIWSRDAYGRWTRTEYDALNRPVKTITSYEDGNPLTGADDADLVTVIRYRPDGQPERQITNTVDELFTVTEPITDRVRLFQYDNLGRTTTTIQNWADGERAPELNRVLTTAYDPATGRVLGQQDALGRWVSQQYDALGRLTRTVQNCRTSSGAASAQDCAPFEPGQPDRNVATETRFDALGRPFERVDPLGHVTHTEYDGVGRATATTANYLDGVYDPAFPDQDVTSRQTYDALGRLVAQQNPDGGTVRQTYNGLGQTTASTDAAQRITRSGYDGQGNLRWTATPEGRLTVYELDGLGRVVRAVENYQDGVISPGEPTDQDLITQTVYDAVGRRVQSSDPAARITQFAYDNLDRLTAVTENAAVGSCAQAPCNVVTGYEYDRAGNRTAIVDANSHRRSFGYDAADQQVRAWDALGQQTEWVYDAGGRLQLLEDPRGANYNVSYDYDGLDRPTGMQAAALDQAITMAYNEAGWRTRFSDETGTTRFAHDALGRITAVTAPETGTVGYSYTPGGERATLTYPDQTRLNYRYWPDGQLWRVEQGPTLLAEYGYNASGLLATVARANGATTSYDYDGAGRLRQLETGVDGQALSQFSYELDRAGLRRVVTERLRLPDTLPSTPTPSSATPTASPTTTLPSATPTASPTTTLPSATPTASTTASPTTTPPNATPPPTTTPIPAVILDSFDRADGPVGSNWTGATSAFQIRDNQLVIAGGDNTLFWSQAFGAEQEASVTLSSIDTNSTEIDLLLKAQDSSGCNLLEVWYQPATSVVQVWTCDVANGWRQQGSDIGVSFAPGDRFGARADAKGEVTVFKNGERMGAVTVGSDWPHRAKGGRIGLWNIGGSNRFDDFAGGSVVGSEPDLTPTTSPSATSCAPLSPLPCSAVAVTVPLHVDWDGSEGGLDDASGEGTGFTMALPPSSPLAAPSNPSAPGYEPTLLSVDTEAQQLVITSTAGKLYINNNSQVNALGVGVAISEPLQVSLTLVAPDLVGSSGDAYQQAGLWFGTDEENYVKLVVMKESGVYGVVQLLPEVQGAAAVEYNTAPLANISSQTVTLTLELDPERETVAAWYQFAGGEREAVAGEQEPVSLPSSFFSGVDHDGDEGTAPVSYLGVLTTHANSAASAISFRVDDFSVAALAAEEEAGSTGLSSQEAPRTHGWSLMEQRAGKPLADSTSQVLAAQAAEEPIYLPLLRGVEREQAAGRQSTALLATALTSRTISYDYDGLSRLSSAVERGASTTSYAYAYDLAGNRTGETVNGVTRTWEYNAANQVEGWEYDAAGNLLSDGTTRSTYDALNRLSSRNGVSYSYNGDGTLVSQSNGTATTLYAQDLVAPLSQVLNDGSANYLYGLDRLAAQTSGTTTWYAADALGSVRQTLDNAGAPLATASYDPWGTPQGNAISPFGFTGELQNAAGMTYLRARWYNPVWGSFSQPDPFPGWDEEPQSLAKYTYVHNNPVNATDPTGLWRWAGTGSVYHRAIEDFHLARTNPVDVHVEYNDRPIRPWRIDVIHSDTGDVYEIEPIYNAHEALPQATAYAILLNWVGSHAPAFGRVPNLQGGAWLPQWKQYNWNHVSWDLGAPARFPPIRIPWTVGPGGGVLPLNNRVADLVAISPADGVVLFWLEPTDATAAAAAALAAATWITDRLKREYSGTRSGGPPPRPLPGPLPRSVPVPNPCPATPYYPNPAPSFPFA